MDIPFRFFPSAVYHQEYCLGRSVMCVTIWRRKFSKTQISPVSKFAQSIMSLRNMSTPNYSNTSHIRKGINYSIQNFLFLMFVNHLLVRKQKGGFFWKERQRSAFRKGMRQRPVPSFQFPAAAISSAQPATATPHPPERTRGL